MIFVVGSQRTGSTLMSMVVGAHPRIDLIGDVDLMNIANGKYCRGSVLHAVVWTARYALLNQYYPNSYYIFMLRDLRAIVSSMLEIDWARRFALEESTRAIIGLPDWEKQYEMVSYFGRIYRENNIVKIAALCAYLKSYQLALYYRHGLNVMPVRYEVFTRSPRLTMEMVLDFLGLPWHDDVLQHHLLTGGTEAAGNDPNRPIDTSSIDKWRTRLAQDDLYDIREVIEYLNTICDEFSNTYSLMSDD